MNKDIYVNRYLERIKCNNIDYADLENLNEIQSDINGNFKIVKLDEEKYQLIRVLDNLNEQIQFTFILEERNLEDFNERCIEFETLPDSYFRKNKFCAIEKEDGKVFLRDDKLVITENNKTEIKEFKNEEEFIANLKSIFGIELL